MDDTDIVTRLRAVFVSHHDVELMNREAAAEIERLRAECERLRRDGLRHINTLVTERDEARRQYCLGFTDFCPNPAHDHLSLEDAAIEVAKSFGWNCFWTETKP